MSCDPSEAKVFKFDIDNAEQCQEMMQEIHNWVASAIASGLSISLKTDLNYNILHGRLVYQGDLFVYRRPKDMRQPAVIPGLDDFDFPEIQDPYNGELAEEQQEAG